MKHLKTILIGIANILGTIFVIGMILFMLFYMTDTVIYLPF